MEIVFEPHSDTTTKSPRPYTTAYTYTFQIALKPRAREGRKHASKKAPHGKQVLYQRNYITHHHPYDMHIYSSSSRDSSPTQKQVLLLLEQATEVRTSPEPILSKTSTESVQNRGISGYDVVPKELDYIKRGSSPSLKRAIRPMTLIQKQIVLLQLHIRIHHGHARS